LLVQAGVRLDAAPISRRKSLASTSRTLALAYNRLPKKVTWNQLKDLPVNPMRCPHLHVTNVRFGTFCIDCGICLERSTTETLLSYETLEQDFIVQQDHKDALLESTQELVEDAVSVARQYPEKINSSRLLRNARLVAQATLDQVQSFSIDNHVGDDSQESPT
jgi:ferredoxin